MIHHWLISCINIVYSSVSDGRKVDAVGRAREPDGSTVDVEKATYTNTIGDALLTACWEDPDSDPAEPLFPLCPHA